MASMERKCLASNKQKEGETACEGSIGPQTVPPSALVRVAESLPPNQDPSALLKGLALYLNQVHPGGEVLDV
jgi:hypothetical protein